MKEVDPKALFRLSVLGPLISRERLARGELQQLIRQLSAREYAIPGTRRRHLGEKTIEAWYYAGAARAWTGSCPRPGPIVVHRSSLLRCRRRSCRPSEPTRAARCARLCGCSKRPARCPPAACRARRCTGCCSSTGCRAAAARARGAAQLQRPLQRVAALWLVRSDARSPLERLRDPP